jgi:endonuclease YncB( thermonuclease family)
MSARLAGLALLALLPLEAFAHTGGLDRYGCHTNEVSGDYHCHRADAERPSTGQSSGLVRVIDGDSLKMGGLEIRLQGIDAVEHEQVCHRDNGERWECGEEATRVLRAFISKRSVTCVHHGTDGYGRTLGTCSVGKTNINDWLVRQGWAIAYTRYSNEYLAAQNEAEMAKRNIWSGTFMNPERWRREQN